MDLEKGKAYFGVSFTEAHTEIPEIETYIFIGKDIFTQGSGEYIFQTPWSYFTHGNFTAIIDQKLKSKAQINVMSSEIVEVLYTLPELIEYLGEAVSKYPTLFGAIVGRHSYK
jgi:hypothetical protein